MRMSRCQAIRDLRIPEVREVIGAFAQPDEIHWAPGLPKTRPDSRVSRVKFMSMCQDARHAEGFR